MLRVGRKLSSNKRGHFIVWFQLNFGNVWISNGLHIIKIQGFLIYVGCDKDTQMIRGISDSHFLEQILHSFKLPGARM